MSGGGTAPGAWLEARRGHQAKTGSSNQAAVVSVFPPNAPFPCKLATGSSCSPREAGDGGNPEPFHNYPHPVSLVGDLRGVLSDDRVLEELVELYLYSRDASLMHGEATCVVFPHTPAEVAEVVLVAEKHGVPIVARGAGTGLAAGAIPVDGGIVLSTTGDE